MVKQKYSLALSLSIGFHVALALFLFLGDFSPEHKPIAQQQANMQPIQAVAVEKSVVEEKIKQIQKQKNDAIKAERKRIKDIEERAKQAKKAQAEEQARIKNLEQQRKKKAAEKKQAEAAAKKAADDAAKAEKLRKVKAAAEQAKAEKAAAAAKLKRIKEKEAAEKAEALKKKQEAERKKAEAEAKRKAAEAKERERQEKLLAEQMAAEMAVRQQARNQQILTEVEKYSAIYQSLIHQNILGDAETFKGKKCTVTISLTIEGSIKYVTVNGGDKYTCDATEKAIWRVNRFPMSSQSDVNRELMNVNLTFSPQT